MKLFQTSAISQIDKLTMQYEPITDIDLMERAATVLFNRFVVSGVSGKIVFFCGPGNNGGDGLALARLLCSLPDMFQPFVYLFNFGHSLSPSAQINLDRLLALKNVPVKKPRDIDELLIEKNAVIVDALLGAGLNRSLEGFAAEVVRFINSSGSKVVAIDVPSGLLGEDNRKNDSDSIVKAHLTYTFQFPKISFLFPENNIFVGDWQLLDIGLHQLAIEQTPSYFHYIEHSDCSNFFRQREKFSHKGNYGHALLVAGAYGKMGAAVLSSKSCLRSGAGLLTVHVPHKTYPVLQIAVPEAMCSIDQSDLMFTEVADLKPYAAIGVGPAIGLKVNAQRGLHNLISKVEVPLVLDADAINILGLNPDWLRFLPPNTILTPHPKEFERIAGSCDCAYTRMEKALAMAKEFNIIVVLKGAHTIIALPCGNVWFNSTGNPGMATAGSGDVLTGVILGLLSQGYTPSEAAILGVYLHGSAGDSAKKVKGEYSLIASDIIENLAEAFKKFELQ
ncbi:MAG: NAD(P)H-hydrate dehydratase [Bacteroidales bacterium]|nr:NAD(P)H-hydrate dehydratase [Bacteroidales bacterium]